MALRDIVKGFCRDSKCLWDVYTKEKADELLKNKANSSEVYTKNSIYNKEEIDEFLEDTYTKTEIDNKVASINNTTSDLRIMVLARKMSSDFEELTANVSEIGIVNFSYPSDFTYTNCVVVSAMYSSDGTVFKTNIGAGSGSGMQVALGKTEIVVTNNIISSGTIKIILMKVS